MIEELYKQLTEKPYIVDGLTYRFINPSGYSNVADLEIDNNNGERIMLSEYLIEENDNKISVRITWVNKETKKLIILKECNIHPKLFGKYMYFTKDEFEQVLNDQLFSVVKFQYETESYSIDHLLE